MIIDSLVLTALAGSGVAMVLVWWAIAEAAARRSRRRAEPRPWTWDEEIESRHSRTWPVDWRAEHWL